MTLAILPSSERHCRGFTLVELLVVVSLIVVLLTVSIPALRTVTQSGKVREASRAINAYLTVAQARAAQTNRPVGVWIERDPNNPDFAIRLYTAEVPPAYTGDFLGSGAVVNVHPGVAPAIPAWGVPMMDDTPPDGQVDNSTEAGLGDDITLPSVSMMAPNPMVHYGPDVLPGKAMFDDDLDGTVDNASEQGWIGSDDNFAVFNTPNWQPATPNGILKFLLANGEVREGDRIRFNRRGPLYRIEQINPALLNAAMPPDLTILHFSHPMYGPPPATVPGSGIVPFQIFRQPRRSSLWSIELPKGTVIDLGHSGLGAGAGTPPGWSGREFTSDRNFDMTPDVQGPVIIMFSPSGAVDLYYVEEVQSMTSIQLVAYRPASPIHLLIGRDDENEDGKIPDNLENPEALWVSIGHTTGSITSSENVGKPGVTLDEARRFARQAQILKGS